VFNSPINFIDTAYSYGDGESERRIGIAIRELGGIPDGYIVATKADRNLQTGDFSGPQMRKSVERSLKLLGIERIQLLYLHDPEHTTFEAVMAPGGVLETLVRCQEEGLIDHLGVAGGPVDMMIRYVETGAFSAMITHNRYTLLNRSADQLLTISAERGLGVMNAAPYGSGMLAKGPGAYPRYAYQDAPPIMVERAQQLAAICERYGVRLAAAALQFSLRDPRITSTIVGVSRPERIDQTLDLAAEVIPDEIWAELDQVGFDRDDPELSRWK
jgi:D-threo-aldose 1-dehydrogenase